jgi:hypothetical protein
MTNLLTIVHGLHKRQRDTIVQNNITNLLTIVHDLHKRQHEIDVRDNISKILTITYEINKRQLIQQLSITPIIQDNITKLLTIAYEINKRQLIQQRSNTQIIQDNITKLLTIAYEINKIQNTPQQQDLIVKQNVSYLLTLVYNIQKQTQSQQNPRVGLFNMVRGLAASMYGLVPKLPDIEPYSIHIDNELLKEANTILNTTNTKFIDVETNKPFNPSDKNKCYFVAKELIGNNGTEDIYAWYWNFEDDNNAKTIYTITPPTILVSGQE